MPSTATKQCASCPARVLLRTTVCRNCWLESKRGRNWAARQHSRTCDTCGVALTTQIRFCSRKCASLAAIEAQRPGALWTPERIAYLREHYPTQGSVAVAAALGLSAQQVRDRGNRLGLTLNSGARQRLVHSAAQRYMRASNPMRRPDVAAKVSDKARNTPAGHAAYARLLAGAQRIQRDQPSKPELRLRRMLDSLNVSHEPAVLIKPNFIVDIRIGRLIIQLDGEYWHGHPRYEPLTERQQKQRQRDRAQDKYLSACGYTVIRLWESDATVERVTRVLADHAAAAFGTSR